MKTPADALLDGIRWRPLPPLDAAESAERYATHEGLLDIGGVRLRCYTLNDGSRVFDADDIARAFGSEESSRTPTETKGLPDG